MAKMRFSFDIDLQQIFPDKPVEEASAAVVHNLINAARVTHMQRFKAGQVNATEHGGDLQQAVQPHLRGIMLTMMAESNWHTEALPDDAEILEELPIERGEGQLVS
ncbi:hypothetical protein [Sphingomonas hankookensis]|uniref:hypothetical protein n=1 Tax=Sphingomonas hankookensis TaxID=563996 RepID=UPI00234E498C|nr:hypothetical protein [Sphingomonas hankookensis]WCP72196.1 hypothetical protein PPZ50_01120 [Sphingomonas hankookensis]